VFLSGGVPSVELQEELRGPSGYTPRGFASNPKTEAKLGFLGFIQTNKDCATVRHFGNRGCSRKSTKNKLVNRSWDKQSQSVNVWP